MLQPRPLSTAVAAALAIASSLAVTLSMTLASRPAYAQPKVDKKQLAKQYTDSGLAAQAAGDFDTAVTFYEKAYEQVAHPVLLFNLAQAHRLAGRLAKARELYQRYLEAEPRGVQSRTARENLIVIDKQLAAEQADAAKQAEEAERAAAELRAEQTRVEEEKRAQEARLAELDRQAAAARRAEEERRADERSGRGQNLRLAGMISGGVGLVGIGAGVFFQLRAGSISDDFSTPGNPYDPDKDDDGKSAERFMYISYGAGAALLAGGAVLYYLGHRARAGGDERPATTALAPSLTPDGQGVGLVFLGVMP